jgi:hypothetical protein
MTGIHRTWKLLRLSTPLSEGWAVASGRLGEKVNGSSFSVLITAQIADAD